MILTGASESEPLAARPVKVIRLRIELIATEPLLKIGLAHSIS